jgi:hypothetical protein
MILAYLLYPVLSNLNSHDKPIGDSLAFLILTP